MDDLLRNIRSTVGETPEEKCLSTKEDLDRALEALLGNVKRNDKKGTVHQARKVAGADLDPLKQMAEGRENERDLLDALDRLSDLLRDLEYQAPKAVETPAGSQQRKEVEDSVREAQNLLDKVAGDSGAAALGAIQKEQKSLRNLHDDLEGDDPANDLKRDIKDVVGDHRDVLEKLKEIEPKVAKDPKRSKELGEAIEEMESLMPELISKTKGVIVNPDDHAAQRELEEAVATVEVPLAKGANAVAPCALNELKARAREVDRAGQGVAAGTMSGDMQKAKKNSDKLDNLEPLKDCVEKRAKEMEKNDPVLARKMRDAMKEVEEASKEVQRNQKDPSKVGEKADKLSRCLRDLEELAEGSDINQVFFFFSFLFFSFLFFSFLFFSFLFFSFLFFSFLFFSFLFFSFLFFSFLFFSFLFFSFLFFSFLFFSFLFFSFLFFSFLFFSFLFFSFLFFSFLFFSFLFFSFLFFSFLFFSFLYYYL